MKDKLLTMSRALVIGGSLTLLAGTANAGPPFGDKASVAYAGKIWQALKQANFVGDEKEVTWSKPYKGTPPHGAVLDTVHGLLTVAGHKGEVIVKRNYGGPGISVEKVTNDPGKWLKIVTVMFKREKGYDSADKDWFWVKFKANGSLAKNAKGMQLAGRVAKGKPKGCIACHQGAPGGDFIWGWTYDE